MSEQAPFSSPASTSSSAPESPSAHQAAGHPPVHPQKQRRGLARMWHAAGYSLDGLCAAWREAAFRQEALFAIVMVPGAFWLGHTWTEIALLAGTVVAVLVVELLNSAVEAAIDRIGPERHELSKSAKDMGSAAVLLSIMLCVLTWGMALLQRFPI